MRTRLHKGTGKRVVNIDMSMNVTDDNLSLTIINTAGRDFFTTDVVMTMGAGVGEGGRERASERG
jgi:hypothetical protein